jgi:hypothetical protein
MRCLLCTFALICLLSSALAFGQETSKEVTQLVEKADKLAADGKYADAAAALEEAVKLAPKNDLLLAKTSEMEHKAGLYKKGLAHAKAALAINDKVGGYHVIAAANAYGLHDLDTARTYIDTVLKGGESFAPALPAARRVDGMLSKKTYTLYWDFDPKKGTPESGVYRLAFPKDELPYQSFSFKITGAKGHKVVKTEVNDVLEVVPQGNKPFQVTMTVTVQPFSYKEKLAARKSVPTPAAVKPYLGSSVAVDPTSPALRKVAKELKSDDPVETVNNIGTWMRKNIEYKVTGKLIDKIDFKTADELLERKHAECLGYSILFTALCRSAGVPARQIWGLYMNPDGKSFASHSWAEVYIGGVGWLPVDPQAPESLGLLPNTHIRFFMPMKRNTKSNEATPQANLLYMSGDKLKFDYKTEPLPSSLSRK